MEDEEYIDNGAPNTKLEKVCDGLFYSKDPQFAGKLGIKAFGDIVGSSDQEFTEYLASMQQTTLNVAPDPEQ